MIRTIRDLMRLDDPAEEREVIEGIERGVNFRGAKLWILVIAVFVASLGLNTNSTAVIIGAMLISPLMGPIIGIGLGLGVNDFELLRRSWRNYIVATIFSIITATIYFLITPLSEVQSELLARTSPTIYDVLIALCGGLAGIIALSSQSQRTGNVIPGVAIATALMPPLCTVGFGIATANWAYAAGALYLFIINTIFIVFATLIGTVFIMKFKKKVYVDTKRDKRIKWLIYSIVFVTMIPAVWLTVGIVRKSYFEQHVNQFVQTEVHFPATQVLSYSTDFDNRAFKVIVLGSEIDSTELVVMRSRLPLYSLEGADMQVIQGSQLEADKQLGLNVASSELKKANALAAHQQVKIAELEQELQPYRRMQQLAPQLLKEAKSLFPQVISIAAASATKVSGDDSGSQAVVIVTLDGRFAQKDQERFTQWVRERLADPEVGVIIQ